MASQGVRNDLATEQQTCLWHVNMESHNRLGPNMCLRRLLQSSQLQRAWRAAFLKHVQGRHLGARRWTHSGGGPYRAVIFDMGGVLLPSPGSVATEWEVQNHIPSGTIVKALISGGENGPWMKFMRAEITTEDFLQEFERLCSEISKTSVPVDSFFSLLTSERVTKQFPVMTEAIIQIWAKGLQTSVLSNNFYLPNGKSFLPLDWKQFDVVVESCMEGVCKPDPRMYKLCLERLSRQPSESIFLDDLGPNLKAAASLGIHTIKVHDPETAVKELETLLGFPLRMAVPNIRLVRKTMEIPKDSLEKYLKDLLGTQPTGPLERLQFDHGQSNPTYYVKLATHQLILRKKPPGTLLPSAHAVEREFRMMEALVNAGAHVPKVCHLCEDSSIVGNPFYLMEYCPGLIHKDPSPPGLEPSQRRAIYTAMKRVLCKIHSVDLKAAGLEDYRKHRQASSATVKQTGKLTEFMCNLAWDFPVKEGFRVFKEMLATKPLMGSHHSWSRPQSLLRTPGTRSYVTSTDSSLAHSSKGALIFSPEGLSPRVRELYQRLKEFMERHVYPVEPELQRHQASAERWTPSPLVEDLKEKAKAEGLWNLFLPLETDPEKKYGAGLTNVEYAHLCEVMGTSLYAPEIFNCSAPDTGNMELLVRYGTEEQKARWLIPLLEGKARSCFAMTEPQVASSDATNIESSIREEDGFYVISGHKWWITGILDPRCQLCVFMGKTDPHAPRHQQQSMFLVPMDTPGIKIIRPLKVYGLEDAPGGHGEVLFEQVRVPKENIILGPGRGLEILLGRLGSGRIHHCMRLIGCSERALALMKARVKSRMAFGKPLVEQGTVLADIALSRVEIEQARLLVLKAAHVMDVAGNKAAALDIAMIKMVAPSMASRVIDRAIQVFGAAGLSSDHPLAQFFVGVRVLRLADQVHQRAVAKMELKHRS
ncbi:acyl-CoA dehydrogenase family member 10-like isoform X1 [Cervus elaphus]|uniref:acyl-CoA dehydrogenase family member 10-like isoform X1 n=2 Tax=Cervus elaphus TaxID=9860 RepID=UPI001CC30D56|nr:acyl-CoA dehydrogenase family member 10-like isoform X1 [Cervus elaphus]